MVCDETDFFSDEAGVSTQQRPVKIQGFNDYTSRVNLARYVSDTDINKAA